MASRVFWDVRDPDKAVVISLHDEGFARLIVEVAAPRIAIEEVEKALARRRGTVTEGVQ